MEKLLIWYKLWMLWMQKIGSICDASLWQNLSSPLSQYRVMELFPLFSTHIQDKILLHHMSEMLHHAKSTEFRNDLGESDRSIFLAPSPMLLIFRRRVGYWDWPQTDWSHKCFTLIVKIYNLVDVKFKYLLINSGPQIIQYDKQVI